MGTVESMIIIITRLLFVLVSLYTVSNISFSLHLVALNRSICMYMCSGPR